MNKINALRDAIGYRLANMALRLATKRYRQLLRGTINLGILSATADNSRWEVVEQPDGRVLITHVDFPGYHWYRDRVLNESPMARVADRMLAQQHPGE